VAREQYEVVLNLTEDPELIDLAKKSIESLSEYESSEQSASAAGHDNLDDTVHVSVDSPEWSNYPTTSEQQDLEDLGMLEDFEVNNFDFNSFEYDRKQSAQLEQQFNNPFGASKDFGVSSSAGEMSPVAFADPFALEQEIHEGYKQQSNEQNVSFEEFYDYNSSIPVGEDGNSIGEQFELPSLPWFEQELPSDEAEDEILFARGKAFEESGTPDSFGYSKSEQFSQTRSGRADFGFEEESQEQNEFNRQENVDLHVFDAVFGSTGGRNGFEENTNHTGQDRYEMAPSAADEQDSNSLMGFELPSEGSIEDSYIYSNKHSYPLRVGNVSQGHDLQHDRQFEQNQPLEPTQTSSPLIPSSSRGWPAFFKNATLEKKQLYTAGAVGAISALVVAACSSVAAMLVPQQSRADVRNTGGVIAVAALIASGGTTLLLGRKQALQLQRTALDLNAQFEAVRLGNFNAKATVYSEDEFGLLASNFNEMTDVIFTTTSEAQRQAEEQEQAKENLQRQVIRLLDDVEGAARGDLTVQAEVSADVLGAVADSFNLTIHNLRQIVQQVKIAARQVSKGATDSETFARALSSDALRQAEELAVTLNSVQAMTDTIQRVAESAREAESVALSASATAKKGGEAVERTVAGILEIRQTVAQTTRKVKRLAESSQEISKIVALISQIASRTNMLALNASIEAARAGESGRGFAIVADEVRQLADRVAKALKEIEQIVRQIQSETGSVMTAMEEGTQQVIQGTHLAEQAKRSLDDILQVSDRIDTLVRSITADTVEQTESSRAVAAVMQSVELTAQENSQEAQRVSGSLQNLVGVAGDLLTFVERFQLGTTELN
jgi:twitching motility protein PilJ